MTGEQLIEAIRQSSYIITEVGGGHWGSGIAISPHHIATAKHVLKACRERFRIVSDYTGLEPQPAGFTYGGKDIAIIKVKDTLPVYLPPSPKSWDQYSPGDMVLAWASASAVDLVRPISVMAGFLTGVSAEPDSDFAFSMGVQLGCSGSGIVHADTGYVIGVVSATYAPVEQLPLEERSISYGVDLYPLASKMGLIKTAGEESVSLPSFKWFSRELLGALVGMGIGTVVGRKL